MKPETADLLGRQVGHIRVVDVLGEGGMGVVYAGFDNVLQRKVAVKAIHSDFRLRDDAKARFLREARILSRLDHPHICTVHDLIEEDDRDFLVLELVRGRNLRDIGKDELDWSAKLRIAELLLEVLVAVHGQGVVHRDLKPENVMVTNDGGIKVLDFGLSRSADEDGPRMSEGLTLCTRDSTTLSKPETAPGGASESSSVYVKTRRGTVLGTVGYMSPEQARGEPATAASDMYSSGLILQELFTGEPPFEPGLSGKDLFEKAAAGESQSASGLPPDLTALINRLKSPVPGARPSSVDALAALKQIRDAPRRRRRRLMTISAWTIMALLTVGMAVQSVRVSREANRANHEAEAARLAQSEAEEVSRFLVELFEVSDPTEARGETVTVREILDRGAQITSAKFKDQPLARARFMRTIGAIYLNLGLFNPAEPLLEDALTICEQGSEMGDQEIADSLSALARLRSAQGRYEDSIRLIRRELEIRRALVGPEHQDVARCESDLCRALYKQGIYEEAESYGRSALEIRERIYGPEHPEVAGSLNDIGTIYVVQGKNEEAENAFLRELAIKQVALGSEHPDVAKVLSNLGVVCSRLDRNEEAIQYYGRSLEIKLRVFGPEHPQVADTLHNIGELQRQLEHFEEAEDSYRRSLEIRQLAFGENHPLIADSLDMLGLVSQLTGRADDAENLYRRALEMRIKTVGPDHPRVALTLSNLGYLLFQQQRYTEAESVLVRALDIRDSVLGPKNPVVADTLTVLGSVYFEQGRFEEAEAVFSRLLALREELLPEGHPYLRWTRTAYERVLRSLGRDREADEIEARSESTVSASTVSEGEADGAKQ